MEKITVGATVSLRHRRHRSREERIGDVNDFFAGL